MFSELYHKFSNVSFDFNFNVLVGVEEMFRMTFSKSFVLNLSFIVAVFTLINMMYPILNWYFSKHYPLYGELPFHRQRYVVKNILKSIYLCLLTVYATYFVGNMFLFDVWDNSAAHELGFLYMMPDLISLFRVPKLDINTQKHHVTVVIFAILNLFCDYSVDTYWRGMVIYSWMSMITGLVNFYLGYRLLEANPKKQSNIAFAALSNYSLSIILNWIYQIWIIYKWILYDFPMTGLYVYIFLIYFVVKDDIILISFLVHNSNLSERLKPIYDKFKGR